MQHTPACTIVSNNYLALARVFAESYTEHHPGADVYVCVVDRAAPEVRYQDFPFKVIFAEDLGIPAFFNLAFRYGILELNTAVKPYLLAYLNDEVGLDRVFYFDPDILVLSTLTSLEQQLQRSTMVLTPHITEPLDDAQRPSERIILMSGVYNLGFLGMRLNDETSGFLKWWQERLYRYCLHDIHNGFFVDQSWMDLAPAFLPNVTIERNPAFNIAYWNLSHRRLHQKGSQWYVDGERAGFFHFSGLVLDNLEAVSRYQDRIRLNERPELRPLFEAYKQRLMEANHDQLRKTPYRFEQFVHSGIAVVPILRRALHRVDPYGLRWPDPFDDQRRDSFLDWLTEPIPMGDGGVLNRAALALWEERADLLHHFPRVWDQHLNAYVYWLRNESEAERSGVSGALLEGISEGRSKRGLSRVLAPTPEEPDKRAPESIAVADLQNPGPLTSWLNESIPAMAPEPIITRLTLKLYEMREDVQERFPNPLGADQQAVAHWFVLSAAKEYGFHKSLVQPVIDSLPRGSRNRARLMLLSRSLKGGKGVKLRPFDASPQILSHPLVRPVSTNSGMVSLARLQTGDKASRRREPHAAEDRLFGVNLAGYFSMESGVGQMGRGAGLALKKAGVPFVEIPIDQDSWARTSRGRVFQPSGAPYPVTLMHVNADEIPRALSLLPVPVAAGTYKIGYWFWELTYFPLALADRFSMLDEIWAPSRFCQGSFETISTIPVRYVPPCVPPPRPQPTSRRRFGMDDKRFYFLFGFDTWSVPERKNPSAVIEAFEQMAAKTRRDVGLVIKVNQASHDPGFVSRLRAEARDSRILIHTDPLNRGQIESLIAQSDCYVSLHRSEGLGLPPIEALYLEKPVIATAYGGVTDFLDESTGYPVPYNLVTLGDEYPPYPKGATWADPDIHAAAEIMLRVVENPEEAAQRAQNGRARVEEMYSVESAAFRIAQELSRIADSQSRVDRPLKEATIHK